MLKIKTVLVASLLMTGSAVAVAAPTATGGVARAEACGPARHYEKLARFDGNKDGTLDAAEQAALAKQRQAKRAQRVAAHDKNRDGKLDRAERVEARHAGRLERFEALDKNRDAEISRAEAAGACGPIARRFDRVDLDRDGSVSWDEFEKAGARKGMKGKHRGRIGGGRQARPAGPVR